MKNGEIIGIGVQKGGVGKSTTANFFSYQLAEQGYNVILVDLDSQATQTGSFFGYRLKGGFKGDNISNIANIFHKKSITPLKIEADKYIDNPEKHKMGESHYNKEKIKIDFIPSNEDLLDSLESDELTKGEKIKIIVDFLIELKKVYDYVIVDCPPSFGIVTTAVLKVVDKLIVPIATKNVDTEGLTGFFDRMDNVYEKEEFNVKKIIIMPNMYDKRVKDSKTTLMQDINQIPNMLQCKLNLRFIPAVVTEPLPQNSSIQEAPSYNMFLVPYIMEWQRSKHSYILLTIKNIVNEIFK